MSRARACVAPALFALACHASAVQADGDDGSSETTTTTVVDASTTAGDVDTGDSSSGGAHRIDVPADLGGGIDPPPARSRFVVDIVTDGGHTLELHELVDGVAVPPLRLVPDTPLTNRFAVTSLGAGDQLALDVTYAGGNHEIFLVAWQGGTPTVESLALASNTTGVYWNADNALALVRTDDHFARFDPAGDDAVPLFGDLPPGIVFQAENPLLPDATVAARGDELYLATLLDPLAPTVQPTSFAGTDQYPRQVQQLAGGHLVYGVYSYVDMPREIHVVPRTHASWGMPVQVPMPDGFDGEPTMPVLMPGGDAFVYQRVPLDPDAVGSLVLEQLAQGQLGEPTVLRDGPVGQLEFTASGDRLVYATTGAATIEVIDFDGELPMAPRQVYAPAQPAGVDVGRISPDGAWLLGERFDPIAQATLAIVRVSLAAGGGEEVLFANDVPTHTTFAPDAKSVAYVTQSASGWQTRVIDFGGPVAGPLVTAADLDAPVLGTPSYSPDGAWLAIEGDSGGTTGMAVVVRTTDPATAVVSLAQLLGPPRWLP